MANTPVAAKTPWPKRAMADDTEQPRTNARNSEELGNMEFDRGTLLAQPDRVQTVAELREAGIPIERSEEREGSVGSNRSLRTSDLVQQMIAIGGETPASAPKRERTPRAARKPKEQN